MGHRQLYVNLPNGYTVSVVRGMFTYGGDRGLFEAAVIGPDGHLVATELTGGDTVIGHLTQEDAIKFLDKVAALPLAAAR